MILIISFWLSLLPYLTAPQPAAEPSVRVAGNDICRIYGSVYLERDPKYKNTAAYTVYLGDEEAFASMVVYRESNKLFADGTGIWHITNKKAFADHVLYVTDNRNFADFTVHFTNVRSYAACRP
ncbi:hypothetical protein I0P70_18895 [Pontibacter sp. FD36]|uniref:7(1) septoil knot domain-containing protein n=1 Tax=Pontibacter lucknowensis TaxID=1077936 RepID=A0A1N7BCP3_9BACT|nr:MULTISPECIES: DUF6150 family protein [Pontibacter]MBF8965323.1 hypothetical protein [Pontibacter sp. FD36]SIR49034.1 hypothetical protein SAMN05421545_3902 [Pontibacter lucknowensis]